MHAPLLHSEGMLTRLNAQTFAILCEQFQEYRELSEELTEDPEKRFFTTENGYEGKSPRLIQRDKALENLTRLWSKFGMTPHGLETIFKQRGSKGRQRVSRVEKFAKSKYQR